MKILRVALLFAEKKGERKCACVWEKWPGQEAPKLNFVKTRTDEN